MVSFAIAAFLVALISTYFVRNIAQKFGVVDKPDSSRKFHGRAVPLLGGISIFVSFWLITGFIIFFKPVLGVELLSKKLIGVFVASLIIMAIGILDDIRPLPSRLRLLFTVIAAALAVILGLGLDKITNPFGGAISVALWMGNVLVFLWLLGMMYTTKITDGLDGLSTGVVAIGSLMIFFLSNSERFYQPNVALLSVVLFSVCLGFLIFNFYPAKIFLGESGSLLIGFLLGVMAVISGGKLATALLVMAIPAFDLGRVIYVRIKNQKPVFEGDRSHLHFQLLEYGLSARTVVLLYYAIAALLGILALVLQSTQKIIALVLLLFVMIAVGWRWRVILK